MMITRKDDSLIYQYDNLKIRIESWGSNSLRIRSWKQAEMPKEDWALLQLENTKPQVSLSGSYGEIRNGSISAVIDYYGKITFLNGRNEVVLEEYHRNRKGFFGNPPPDDYQRGFGSSLEIEAKEFHPILGGDYRLTARFESDPEERLYGLGQYQQPFLNLKGGDFELAQRNSQASVPFVQSSLGYGFLWNNPAVGRVTFARNLTTWEAESTKGLDYFVTVGETPAEIQEAYGRATGCPPMMPDYALGFWQSKLRYQTQEELLSVAREYTRRGLPLSVIVADYFHWTSQGDWKFDEEYWPDPAGMVHELKSMGIELMVSIWPTVDKQSSNYHELEEKGFLIRTDRGYRMALDIHGQTVHIDPTNPEARTWLWNTIEKNYFDKGIKLFWLDEAEPEYNHYDFDIYRYHLGPNLQVGNIYPLKYSQTFYEGLQSRGISQVVNLVRCAWAGSQRYGALVWSGDIHSSFRSLREQLAAGLNIGIAGIPWWTTDIGGFIGGNVNDPEFRELFVRWFQFGTFCPVMRSHGYREPIQEALNPKGISGGGICPSGAENEVYSYGTEVYEICRDYLRLREDMKPYIRSLMTEAHQKNTPVMRTLFFEFPEDSRSWDIEDQYMFGESVLVAPILDKGIRERSVYLPSEGRFRDFWSGRKYSGGQTLMVNAPLDQIPLFIRLESKGAEYFGNVHPESVPEAE